MAAWERIEITDVKKKCNLGMNCISLSTVAPYRSEIQDTTKSMKNRRACGVDGIPMEVWKIPFMQERSFDLN